MIVYIITNRVNDKVYVGRTRQELAYRWKQHTWCALRGEDGYLYAAMRKYGIEAFSIHPLTTACTPEQLYELEEYFVAKLRSNDPKYGYNLTVGGEQVRSPGPLSQEHRKHIGEAMRQRHASPDNPWARVGGLLAGRVMSEEQRAAIIKTKQDYPWKASPETRRRMSESHRNVPKPKEVRALISEKAKLRVGSKNNQFGTRWVTNGKIVKKIKGVEVDSYLTTGWQLGRSWRQQ